MDLKFTMSSKLQLNYETEIYENELYECMK